MRQLDVECIDVVVDSEISSSGFVSFCSSGKFPEVFMTIFSTSKRSCFSTIVAISNGDEVSELNVSCDLGEALIMTTHQHPKKYATYVDERVWLRPNIADAKTTFDLSFLSSSNTLRSV